MVSWHGFIFNLIDRFWENCRIFAYSNRTIFEIFFVLIYALEQGLLVKFTFTANNLNELNYVISIFAIIVLTTFSLHKLLMESRIKLLEDKVKDLQRDKFDLESKTKVVKDGYRELFEATKSLYNQKPNNIRKKVKNG